MECISAEGNKYTCGEMYSCCGTSHCCRDWYGLWWFWSGLLFAGVVVFVMIVYIFRKRAARKGPRSKNILSDEDFSVGVNIPSNSAAPGAFIPPAPVYTCKPEESVGVADLGLGVDVDRSKKHNGSVEIVCGADATVTPFPLGDKTNTRPNGAVGSNVTSSINNGVQVGEDEGRQMETVPLGERRNLGVNGVSSSLSVNVGIDTLPSYETHQEVSFASPPTTPRAS
eukprot:Nk52_evm5s383 gene=Nk52_evmTU5s383